MPQKESQTWSVSVDCDAKLSELFGLLRNVDHPYESGETDSYQHSGSILEWQTL